MVSINFYNENMLRKNSLSLQSQATNVRSFSAKTDKINAQDKPVSKNKKHNSWQKYLPVALMGTATSGLLSFNYFGSKNVPRNPYAKFLLNPTIPGYVKPIAERNWFAFLNNAYPLNETIKPGQAEKILDGRFDDILEKSPRFISIPYAKKFSPEFHDHNIGHLLLRFNGSDDQFSKNKITSVLERHSLSNQKIIPQVRRIAEASASNNRKFVGMYERIDKILFADREKNAFLKPYPKPRVEAEASQFLISHSSAASNVEDINLYIKGHQAENLITHIEDNIIRSQNHSAARSTVSKIQKYFVFTSPMDTLWTPVRNERTFRGNYLSLADIQNYPQHVAEFFKTHVDDKNIIPELLNQQKNPYSAMRVIRVASPPILPESAAIEALRPLQLDALRLGFNPNTIGEFEKYMLRYQSPGHGLISDLSHIGGAAKGLSVLVAAGVALAAYASYRKATAPQA